MDTISGMESLERLRAYLVNMGKETDNMPVREAALDLAEQMATLALSLRASWDQKKVQIVF